MSSTTQRAADGSVSNQTSLPKTKSGVLSRALMGIFVIATAVAVAFVLVLLQEQPIRDAERLLSKGLEEKQASLALGETPDSDSLRDAYHKISEFLESHPDNSRGRALQARILFHVDRPEEAIKIFEEVGPGELEELQDFARCYVSLEEYSKALPLMEQVLRLDPNYTDTLYEITTCRMKMARLQEALESAQQLATQSGQEAKGNLLIASIQSELDNRSGTLAAFEKVLEHEPEAENLGIPAWQVFYLYGSALLLDGQVEPAVTRLERSLEINRHPDTYVKLGEAYLTAGEGQKAEQAWRMAINMIPNHPSAREKLASYELSQGNAEQALEWLKPLENGVNSSTLAYSFQRAHQLLGNAEEMEKWQAKAERLRKGETLVNAINSVLESQPESMWGIALRSHRFGAMENWNQAESLLSRLRIDSESHEFLVDLKSAVQQKRVDMLPRLEKLPIELE